MTHSKKFRKLLIANRGEIAVRVLRACRELDIQTVSIYSECDRLSPHVLWADEAHCVGPSPAGESYLKMDEILAIAKRRGADAIHPGYGFLSENSDFSDACRSEGITFIGPKGESMRALGDKIRARQVAQRIGIPVVPGIDRPLQDLAEALETAKSIGYPVLLKASAGGGGRGMQTVHRPEEMESALRRATSEARQSFKDPTVFMEKYVLEPHHVEIQILGDRHGEVVSLGERECSVQRRHQKIIEETPSPFITEETRQKLSDAALRLAREVGYENAGTMEFLVDKYQNFYFLEMNARLQVEHPVTEQRTGIDLVRSQIKVAMGESIRSFLNRDIQFQGHAIECRINAENPEEDFFPSAGKIQKLHAPSGPGIRVDTAIYAGAEIPIYYDSMVAKLIAWGPTREKALQKMSRALQEYEIQGPKTNLQFLQNILLHAAFKAGSYDTGFVTTYLQELLHPKVEREEFLAAIAAFLHHEKFSKGIFGPKPSPSAGLSPWKWASRREAFRNAS